MSINANGIGAAQQAGGAGSVRGETAGNSAMASQFNSCVAHAKAEKAGGCQKAESANGGGDQDIKALLAQLQQLIQKLEQMLGGEKPGTEQGMQADTATKGTA